MDVVQSTSRAPRTGSPDESGISGKSVQSNQSTTNLSRTHVHGNGVDSKDAKSSKTTNLFNTENGSLSDHRTDSSSKTTNNGKNRASNYIPPVKSRDHNTRSKNGVHKEAKSVSKQSAVT